MIKYDCGEPAFDNIDDLLAEKIVDHSKRHSGRTEKRASTQPENRERTTALPAEEEDENSGPWIVAAALVLLALLFLLYHLFDRKPAR